MITRLRANNFRCLAPLDIPFNSFGVLCGPNGAGKSSVFDALKIVCDLASGDKSTDDPNAVGFREHTNWIVDNKVVEFEVDVVVGDQSFTYALHIEQLRDTVPPRVVHERAACGGRTLFERDLDGVKFPRSSGEMTGFPLDWRQAALGSIQPAATRPEIEILQQAIRSVIILRPNPIDVEAESKNESQRPDVRLANLTSWYRYLSQEQEWTDHLRESLREVWPDFRSFRLVNTGLQAKALQLRFGSDAHAESGALFIDQLSDGQKMLVGLYMIQSALFSGAAETVFIDEPDNFVGLPELQPWLLSMMSFLGSGKQAILISHNPEILNTAGQDFGRYLWRESHTSLTRIGPLRIVEGLTAAETIARGWVQDG